MARRPRDAEATRKAILDKAEELFVRQGVGSTSMAQISAACGCANSLIVHHFQSKKGLWNAVKDRAFEGFVAKSKAMFSGKPVSVQDLRETTVAYFRLLQDNPGLVQLLLRAELERDLEWNQINKEQLAPFVARMREAQAAGILRADVPAAHLLLIVINVITRWFEARHMFEEWLGSASADRDGEFLDNVLKVLFEGALSTQGRGLKA
jgi:TetR/AcrR family transcriptional regulator